MSQAKLKEGQTKEAFFEENYPEIFATLAEELKKPEFIIQVILNFNRDYRGMDDEELSKLRFELEKEKPR